MLETLEKLAVPQISFLTLLTISLLLDIICMKARRISIVFLYLECASILVETILLGHEVSLTTASITLRFTFTVVFLGVEALSSILSVTFCSILTHTLKILVLQEPNSQDANRIDVKLEGALGTLIVFTTATAFWMCIHHIAQIRAELNCQAVQRDAIINDLPANVQIAIVSITDFQCLH